VEFARPPRSQSRDERAPTLWGREATGDGGARIGAPAARGPNPAAAGDDAVNHRLELLASVFDDSPEPVAVVDREGRPWYANAPCADLFGVTVAEIVGRPLTDFAVPRDPEPSPASADPCVLRGRVEVRRPDGESRWVAWSASPLRDVGTPGIGAVVFLRDDTERRREELRWTRRRDDLEQTIRAVAHDLRSPLVAVLGFSRLLQDDLGALLGERGTRYLQRITEAGRTMETLIRELLDFARIGHTDERRTLVSAREVLEQLRGEVKPRLDERGVRLVIPDEPPLLHCDRTRLYQLFSNLIGNALDHMGACPEPCIEVQVRDEDAGWHRITVRDNGRGIDPGEHERIFEMFHSVAHEGGRRGTGIGLAIVKKIAELHGGRSWVESAPGAGAAFHVLLPRP
jgi:PAS domain S-box-containing protein